MYSPEIQNSMQGLVCTVQGKMLIQKSESAKSEFKNKKSQISTPG